MALEQKAPTPFSHYLVRRPTHCNQSERGSRCTRCDGRQRTTANAVPCTRCNGTGREPRS